MTVTLVPMRDYTLRDAPAILRKIADEVEAGHYGEVGEIAAVIMGDKTYTFGFGPTQDGTSTFALLSAGALQLVRAIADHGIV